MVKSEFFLLKLHNINSIVHHSWQSYVKSRRKGEKVDDVMDSAVDDVGACRYFCGSWWCR